MTNSHPPTHSLEAFEQSDSRQIVAIMLKILHILPIFYGIIILTRLFARDYSEAIFLGLGFLLLNMARFLLKRNGISLAVSIISVVILLQVSAIATHSYGARDLALYAYPGILIIMSLLLSSRLFYLLLTMTMASVAWIALGPVLGLYSPKPFPGPSINDFVILMTLTLLTGLMARLLSGNSRQNLKRARNEIMKSDAMASVIQENLKEKDMLLKEIHHRVKNNLTVINSLLSLQKRHIVTTEDALSAFDDMRSRIISMSLVHEQLYKSDNFTDIAMRPYIETMAKRLQALVALKERVEINVSVPDIRLSIDLAVPCGIIINEIATNAFKHAFHKTPNPQLAISLEETDENIRLTISDNGPGLPKTELHDLPQTMGLKLIDLLSEQLDAEVKVDCSHGTAYHLSFPKSYHIK